jgi:RHS repeat-associated protein
LVFAKEFRVPAFKQGELWDYFRESSREVLETYTHGADLSGQIGGEAGGIGGLLSSTREAEAVFYHYDFNGNIVHISSSNQVPLASYTYSPFGEVLLKEGPFDSRYQFSTKEYDEPTAMNYYGYRFYNPELGRWINRDPLGERGGANRYRFARNAPVTYLDLLGLRDVTFVIYHNFPDNELTAGAKAEAERIFQDCFKECDQQKCHTVKFDWQKTDKTSDNYKDLDLGMSGGNLFGFNPTRTEMFLDRVTDSAVAGYNNGTYSFANPDRVREQATDYDVGMGVVIAHEIGLHGIGHYTDLWSDQTGYVDSRHPPSSGTPVFRADRCQEICDYLDIDTK